MNEKFSSTFPNTSQLTYKMAGSTRLIAIVYLKNRSVFADHLSNLLNNKGFHTEKYPLDTTIDKMGHQLFSTSINKHRIVILILSDDWKRVPHLNMLSTNLHNNIYSNPPKLPISIAEERNQCKNMDGEFVQFSPIYNNTVLEPIYAEYFDDDGIINEICSRIDGYFEEWNKKIEVRRVEQQRVEATADTYVSQSLEELRNRERDLKRIAFGWYGLALVSLLSGLVFGIFRATTTLGDANITWQATAQLMVVSLIIIGLLGAVARFSYTLGKSFMVESLRNSDRIHAISFGQFYLQAYGERAEWSEIKEAFQHWNIDKGSSFIQQDAKDIDPQILKTGIEIAKILAPKSKSE